MRAATARSRLSQRLRAARGAGVPISRAERWRAARRDESDARVAFADLSSWPTWPGMGDGNRDRVWRIAALVAGRDALRGCIDGAALRGYAALVGETAVEAVLELPDGGPAKLPAASRLKRSGQAIAEAALPARLAAALGRTTRADTDAARDIDAAERIARETAA